MKKTIAIIGSSFAGYTTAISLARLLDDKHRIVVIDRKPEFIFVPSLVWHPFGYRKTDDISFNVLPIYSDLGITFIETEVYGFDLKDQVIYTSEQDIHYDYLVIATGSHPNFQSVKGLIPGKTGWSICNMREAEQTRKAWNSFVKRPGPLVVGAAQWSGYFFVAYEFLLNAVYHLKRNHLLDRVPIHFITAEPYLTHFGIGGLHEDIKACEELFDRYNIQVHTNAEIHEVRKKIILLENGVEIPYSFSMIMPQFVGESAIKTTRGLSDEHGLIEVNGEFQHLEYPNVYAAGASVYIPQLEETKVECGVPRTHSSSSIMAKAVAYNIASDIDDGVRVSVSTRRLYEYCKLDMDHIGLILFGREHSGEHDLDYIARGSQDKWANHSIERYIEASFDPEYLKI